MKQNRQLHWYAVILAGGSGTRLWPLSRQKTPKQFLKLGSDKSLLQEMFDRVAKVLPIKNILVIVTQEHQQQAQVQLPQLPAQNLITEPKGRNTSAAIGLTTSHIVRRDEQAIVASLAADHHIEKPKVFAAVLEHAFEVADQFKHWVVTVGIKPTYPETSYGYIRIGKQVHNATKKDDRHDLQVFLVRQFIEKPDYPSAQKFYNSFEYLWNAAYFIFPGRYMLRQLSKHAPKIYSRIEKISRAIGQPDYQSILKKHYASMPAEPIDTAVMEKERAIMVVPADIGWSDVGSWSNLHEILSKQEGSGLVTRAHHIGYQTENSLIMAQNKLVATLGLKNVVIIDTPDVLLVADKSASQDIKQLIEIIKQKVPGKFL